jgi:protease I
MRTRIGKTTLFIAATVAMGLATATTSAQDSTPAVGGAEQGFVSIFNGTDLSGWDGDPRLWSVKDGAICGRTTEENPAKSNTFCIWRGGTVRNFILEIEFRIHGGNSGVQYRSRDLGGWSVSGYQAEVCNKQGQVGFLYDERGRGWMARVGEFMLVDENGKKTVVSRVADRDDLIAAGYYREKDWNQYTIVARGNHLMHFLNGFQTIEMIDRDPEGRSLEGVLALQIHSGPPMTVEYKDIRIKHLPDRFGQTKLLFNGEDFSGWTFYPPEVRNVWSVESSAMVNEGKPRGYIRTTEDYTNYILRLQFRHLTKGNSGLLLRQVGEDRVWPRCMEAQGMYGSVGDIWNLGEFPMKTSPERTKGRHTVKMHESNERPLGRWNSYEITLDGETLEIEVNGLVQNTATACWETPGKICIQSEGARMEYRNIVLIPIVDGGGKSAGKVLLPIGDGSEVLDTLYAYHRIAEDGYEVVVAGPQTRHYHLVIHEIPPGSDQPWDITRELPGYHLEAKVAFRDVDVSEFAGLYVSGGRAPEYLRYDEDLLRITRRFFEENKPVAALCHGIEILSASGAIEGRRATTIPKCALDVEQGRAVYVAKPCVVDGNLVTARGKRDLAPLLRQFMKMLNAYTGNEP